VHQSIASLEDNNANLKAGLKEVDIKVSDNQVGISLIDEKVKSHTTDLSGVHQSIASLEYSNAGLKAGLKGVEAKVGNNKVEMSQLRNDIKRNSIKNSIWFEARNSGWQNPGVLTYTGMSGSGMNSWSGKFTAPTTGAYVFNIHVLTDRKGKCLVKILQNGRVLASAYDEDRSNESQIGDSVIAQLNAGDQVWAEVEKVDNNYNGVNSAHFTGYILA